jgi:hypothetical protein
MESELAETKKALAKSQRQNEQLRCELATAWEGWGRCMMRDALDEDDGESMSLAVALLEKATKAARIRVR